MSQTPSEDELAVLIQQAEGVASRQARRVELKQASPGVAKPALGAFLGLVAACAGYAIWAMMTPPSADKVARDLEAAVEAARQSIEKAKDESGRLPDALPNASLGSLVRYQRVREEYSLSASVLGIRVTLQRDGSKSVEKGVTE